jgi:hypothetical protein
VVFCGILWYSVVSVRGPLPHTLNFSENFFWCNSNSTGIPPDPPLAPLNVSLLFTPRTPFVLLSFLIGVSLHLTWVT